MSVHEGPDATFGDKGRHALNENAVLRVCEPADSLPLDATDTWDLQTHCESFVRVNARAAWQATCTTDMDKVGNRARLRV